jgi:hypothetical protein
MLSQGAKDSAMWFRVLSILIGVALLLKATIALAAGRRFYGARSRQYESATAPRKVVIASALVIAVTATAWYAVIFHYRPWGWVVAGFLTALACGSLNQVLRWQRHRQRMLLVVTNPNVWVVDCVLLAVGAGFLLLAVFVFS